MKIKKQYHGNRFASVLRKKAQKAAAASTGTEMEALESRILLSGIGTGLNKKSVTFHDADGDLVTIKATGKGASFDIDLGGASDNADIANINIHGAGASLAILVKPVGSLTKPVKTPVVFNGEGDTNVSFRENQAYYDLTPGYTTIGSITTDSTALGSLGVNGAVVGDIDLHQATIKNINIGTGLVAKVDKLMNSELNRDANMNWTSGLGLIDVHDIEAKQITGGIHFAGSVDGGNDFVGNITVANGIGRITGLTSNYFGQIIIEGKSASLGKIVVAGWGQGSAVSTAGDLTFDASNFSGTLLVGGHLNLGLQNGGLSGLVIAKNGISGLSSSTTDAIFMGGGFNRITGQIMNKSATAGISDIYLTNAFLDGATIESDSSIGTITIGGTHNGFPINNNSAIIADKLAGLVVRNGDDLSKTTISVKTNIASIDIANGNLSASIESGSIGNVIVRGGSLTDRASIIADIGNIGDVSIQGGSLQGRVWSVAGAVGNVSVQGGNLSGTVQAAAGGIGNVTVQGGALSGSLLSQGNIGAVTAGLGVSGSITAQGALSSLTTGSNGFSGYVDVVSITNAVDVTGNISGSIDADGSIGNIVTHVDRVSGQSGNISGRITAGNNPLTGGNIGDVTLAGGFDGGSINALHSTTAANGNIGAVTIGDGRSNTGTIFAEGALSSLTVKGGGLSVGVSAGSITGKVDVTGNIYTNITAQGSIGGIITRADKASNEVGYVNADITAGNDGDTGGNIGDVTLADGILAGHAISANKSIPDANGVRINGTIGAVTIGNGINSYGTIYAGGALASLTVAKGGLNGLVDVGSITGAVDVTGNIQADIYSDESIGSITTHADQTYDQAGDITSVNIIAGYNRQLGGNIGAIKLAGSMDGFITAYESYITGKNGDITSIESAGLSGVVQGGSIGPVTIIGGNFNGTLTTTVGAIGDIQVKSAIIRGSTTGGNINDAMVQSHTNIGNITGDAGTGSSSMQRIYISTATDKSTVGNITFDNLSNGQDAVVVFGALPGSGSDYNNTLSVGNISVKTANTDPADVADLTIVGYGGAVLGIGNITSDGGTALTGLRSVTSIGNISVGGTLTFNTQLDNATSVGTLTADSVNNILGADVTVGTGAAGSSIGKITIANDYSGAKSIEFDFATMNTYTSASTGTSVVATVDGTDITVNDAKAGNFNLAGSSIYFTLV